MLKIVKQLLIGYLYQLKLSSIKVENGEFLTLYFKNYYPSIISRWIIIKDRDTNREVRSRLVNKKCKVPLSEIYNINSNGVFDISIRITFYKSKLSKKITIYPGVSLIEHIDEVGGIKARFIKSKNQRLLLTLKQVDYDIKLLDWKNIGNNIFLKGKITSKNSMSYSKAELILVRRDNGSAVGFTCELDKNNDVFDVVLLLDKLQEKLEVNSRWDIIIQLRNKENKVLHRDLIMLDNSDGRFDREEDRYLLNSLKYESITSLYVTMGKNSLALWYTDEKQFLRTYNIAKGKSIYNEVSSNFKIDDKMVFLRAFLGKIIRVILNIFMKRC